MNWPVLLMTALANGLNPCGIGLTVMFLGYLLMFGKSKSLGLFGTIYVFSVLVTYLIVGLIFFRLAFYLQRIELGIYLNRLVGIVLGILALTQIGNAIWPEGRWHFSMPGWVNEKMLKLADRISLPVAVVMGVVTTAIGTPCTLPLYLGTVTVLVNLNLPPMEVALKFLFYNMILVLPLIVVLAVMLKGRQVMEIKEWSHRTEKWWRLMLGVMMIAISLWLIGK